MATLQTIGWGILLAVGSVIGAICVVYMLAAILIVGACYVVLAILAEIILFLFTGGNCKCARRFRF
jgi:hypothetical protein